MMENQNQPVPPPSPPVKYEGVFPCVQQMVSKTDEDSSSPLEMMEH